MTEQMTYLLQVLGKLKSCADVGYDYKKDESPFIDYILSDKNEHKLLRNFINPNTNKPWIDKDDDFLMGDSGGILMNINFVFVGTEIFSRTAKFFDEHGVYTLAPEGTSEYKEFWQREFSRRIKGVSARCKLYFKDIPAYLNAKTEAERKTLLQPLRITGEHYNYLNYGRIERVPNERERAYLDSQGFTKVNTVEGFPRFWDGDYWNFKIDELIANNHYNLCKAKARRKGFSYKRGSQAANTLNANKNVTVTLAADNLSYLTDKGATSYMVKVNLDWYENNTYWQRGYLSENFENGIELGYKKTKDGQKAYGFRSKLISVAIGKNESAAVGKKSIETDFEEAGKCPNLQKALDVMKSNSESGAIQIGTIRVYGTGGTKGANWEAFSRAFYNPSENDMLPMENVWDVNKRHTVCGFFFPQIWCYEPYIEDGNSLIFDAWEHDKERKFNARKNQNSTNYNIFVAQRANTPSEAFISTQENIFHSPELTEHIQNLLHDNSYKFYKDGWYIIEDGIVKFITKEECINRNIFGNHKFHDYITDVPHNSRTDVHGCVREYYPPVANSGNLYFAAVDAYRVDLLEKNVTIKHSLYSFQIWMRNNEESGFQGKRLVAAYCGRLDSMEDNDRVLLYACLRYNCKCLIEAGTGETIPNFKKWGYRKLLMRDPSTYIDRHVKTNTAEAYGVVVGDGDKKLEGLRIWRDMMYEVVGYGEDGSPIYMFQHIYDAPLLLECDRYIYGKNFDRLSTAIVAAFEFQKDSILIERAANKKINNSEAGKNRRLSQRMTR